MTKQTDKPTSRVIATRPPILHGRTHRFQTGCGKLYITVNKADGIPLEVFAHLGKVGGCASAFLDALTRMISVSMRAGVSAEDVIRYMEGIKCPSGAFNNKKYVTSCADAIADALKLEIDTEKEEE